MPLIANLSPKKLLAKLLPQKVLARQLGHPSGFLGRVVAHQLNRVNANMNQATVQRLDPQPGDHVLEIGFGGGSMFRDVATRLGDGKIFGVEVSETMIARAGTEFSDLIAADKLELKHGPVEKLPFADESFDRVMTVNTVYFWPDVEAAFREIRRVLRPDSVVAVAFSSPEEMATYPVTRHGFILRSEAEISQAMTAAGLDGLVTHHGRDGFAEFICVLGRRPG